METLAERLTRAMKHRSVTKQADLARACGVKTSSVADWFNGETKTLGPKAARAAAAFFRCSRDWIGYGIGPPNWEEEKPDYLAKEESVLPYSQPSRVVPVHELVERLASLLEGLNKADRQAAADDLAALSRSPDSRIARDDLTRTLGATPAASAPVQSKQTGT